MDNLPLSYVCRDLPNILIIHHGLEDLALDSSATIPSRKKVTAHKERSMGKTETYHTSQTTIPLLNNNSLAVKNP